VAALLGALRGGLPRQGLEPKASARVVDEFEHFVAQLFRRSSQASVYSSRNSLWHAIQRKTVALPAIPTSSLVSGFPNSLRSAALSGAQLTPGGTVVFGGLTPTRA
jgi:hypothetical protein